MKKIYGGPMSNAGRCHVLAREIGLEYEMIHVDLAKGEQKKPEYLALNPNGKIPCLDDDGFILWESMAINTYLASKYKPDLLGASLEDRAIIDQWSYWSILEAQPAFIKVLYHRFILPEEKRDPKVLQEGLDLIPTLLSVLDQHLEGKEYMMGSTFSLADINVGSAINLAKGVEYNLAKYPNVTKWLDVINQRPAFQPKS